MGARPIKEDIYAVGAVDWERRLFDEVIPIPDGTSYNSYLIKGSEKTALIDTVDPAKSDLLLCNLDELQLQGIDYVVSHHAEQDHSGTLPKILEKYPRAMVVTNPKCKEMLKDLLPLAADRFITVTDRETISLGNKMLEFIYTPWVHWPETMCTYLREDKILFSCDFFGAHLATSETFATDEAKVVNQAKRYYAEIMMPFRVSIKKHLELLRNYQIEMIAPSHGPVYGKPRIILDAYGDWVSDRVENVVLLPFVSMHGSTAEMILYLADQLAKRGVGVRPFDLVKTDLGELAMALVDAASVVIGSPTFLSGPHPVVVNAAYLINALRPKIKYAALVGSFSWGGKTEETLKDLLANLKADWLPSVIIKGAPKDADYAALDQLAADIATRHKSL